MEADYYFEGPEKNLEVWFRPVESVVATTPELELGRKLPRRSQGLGLRSISRASWEELLSAVRCTILSSTHTDYMDSFVLSESSMFITPFRFILKTCGQTTLLLALEKLLSLAAGAGLVCEELFFSRHHLGRPDLQRFPHKSFDEEVKFLDQVFEGSAFSLGRINDKDTCYLYTLDSEGAVPVADQTLEILMSDLDATAMQAFYKSEDVADFAQASLRSGISELFPDAVLDGFLFEPCGYSVNAMMDEHYFTIHVTPQQQFSFASFETDLPMEDYTELVDRVLRIFRPGRATVTIMANHAAGRQPAAPRSLRDYAVCDVQRQELASYHIVYARVRKPTTPRGSKVLLAPPLALPCAFAAERPAEVEPQAV